MDEDWGLVERFKSGDLSAFHEIFNKYKGRVVNLAFRFVKQREAAEDVAQDVFVKLYEKKVKIDPRAKFFTWLYRVTVNRALDVVRSRKFLSRSMEEPLRDGSGMEFIETVRDPASVPPGHQLAQEELKGILQREMEKLPEGLRSPLLLYQFEEMPYRGIAQALGITEKAVERRIYRAKEILRGVLKGLGV